MRGRPANIGLELVDRLSYMHMTVRPNPNGR